MKRLLAIFLFMFLFSISECEISQKAKLIAKSLLEIKKLSEARKTRHLQTDTGDNDEPFNPPTNNRRASIQFLDINGYNKGQFLDINGYNKGAVSNNHQQINFNIFFYFLNMVMPDKVFVPLKVNHNRLRNLADETVQAECTRTAGTETEEDSAGGQSQKFNCGANVETSTGVKDLSICGANVETSTGVKDLSISSTDPIITQVGNKNTTAAASDISFTEDAKNAGSDLENAVNNVDKTLILQNGVLGGPTGNKFTINGDLVEIENGKTINLNLDSEIPCIVTRTGGDAVQLNCNTNGASVDSDLFFKSGMEGTTKVFLNMTDENSHIKITGDNSTNDNARSYYRKSSSGLSGGAIAGIVIACVVALIAASIAAIMLRKPTVAQPVENTTAVQLRTVENI